ncbi:MAG TPA: hypothetical protein VEX41_02740 [Candidatus Eisenbacteria bacterium]|nr:hypothetical protein [Candidatus Eisenbacteria bacterium]
MVREIRPVERDDLDELTVVARTISRDGRRGPGAVSPGAVDAAPRRPDESATFEPRRLSRMRSGPPIALAAWLGVLVLFVGAGFLGQQPGDSRGLAPAPAAVASPVVPVALPRTPNPIDLVSPEVGPITITTARLTVKGTVLVRASRVVVSLEARGNRTLETLTFDVSDPDGGVRPKQSPTFSAEFDIPFPRPNGTMWVTVTAYDSHLIPLGGERRPIRIGEIMGWPAAPGVG